MDQKQGFIISSSWCEEAGENYVELFVRGFDQELHKLKFTHERFTLFIAQDGKVPSSLYHERKELPLRSFNKKNVSALYTKNQSQFLKLKEHLQDNAIRSYENDIWPNDRFLMERFIFGDIKFSGELDHSYGGYINPSLEPTQPKPVQFQNLSFDIETGVGGEVYSIGVCYYGIRKLEKVYMLTDQFNIKDPITSFYFNEKELIQAFLKDFLEIDPDIIMGWHVVGFDLNFLIKRCERLNIHFELSRSKKRMSLRELKGTQSFIDIPGRSVIDGPKAMKAMFLSFPNLKLETVSQQVLGGSKDIASDGGKVEEIERRFKEDKLALARYNLLDCTLVKDIYDKLEVIKFYLARTRNCGLLFSKLGISTLEFDYNYLPKLHREGYVAPNSSDLQREEQSTGGYVLEPEVGLHTEIGVFDYKSLYPSIIRTFKIDPLSLVDSEIDTIKTPTGLSFSQSRHILPDIITKLMKQRELAKTNKDNSLSMAIKILMNSFYGIMGSSRSRFYHSDLPSAITLTGQWIIKKTIEFLDNHNIKTIYGDTDSIFLDLKSSHLSPQEILDEVNAYFKKILKIEFNLESYLELEFENIFEKIFFSPMRQGEGGAKKKYAALLKGELHFKGMEVVRSDVTELAKDFQLKLFTHFFAGEALESFIKNYVSELKLGLFDDKLFYKKRLSKDIKEYTKSIPIHVQAAKLVKHTGPYRLKEVTYAITKNGPIPIEMRPQNFDYEHYVEKQIKPISDQVLFVQGSSYDTLFSGKQLDLLGF